MEYILHYKKKRMSRCQSSVDCGDGKICQGGTCVSASCSTAADCDGYPCASGKCNK